MFASKRILKVFLCHAHVDHDAVRVLYTRLAQEGMDIWLDKKKLVPGQNWELEIRKAVREADVVVVCLSKQFNQEGFRQKEVRWALDTAMKQPEGEIFIVPVRLEECDTLQSLRKWHWVDLYDDNGYERLIQALRARANNVGTTVQAEKNKLPRSKVLRNKPITETILTFISIVATMIVVFLSVSTLKNSNNNYVYATSDISGKQEIYPVSENIRQITYTSGNGESWSPAPDNHGNSYYTSNQGGKTEIYAINNKGNKLEITRSPGHSKSWSPAPDGKGNLYFTSDRGGKAEIYLLDNNGNLIQAIDSPGHSESWSPAPDGKGNLYFTSNRDGKSEIYLLDNNGNLIQATDSPGQSESWSPAPDGKGNLYFTSNRDGKAEIYLLDNNENLIRATHSPGQSESWSPAPDGKGNLYFTSNRDGKIEVLVLSDGVVKKIFQGWTGTLDEQHPDN